MPDPDKSTLSHEQIIRMVPLFADLSEEECAELYRSSELVNARPGDLIIREGDMGDSLYIVLAGELEVTKREGDRDILLATRSVGDFIGEMALLEEAPRSASVRAVRDSELLAVGPDAFHALLRHRPSAATTVLRTVAARLRGTETSLVQSEKLASLGTLAAGLAHELNNPAAAIQRSVGYLREAIDGWRRRSVELDHLQLTDAERQQLSALELRIIESGAPQKATAGTGKAESQLEARLDDLGADEPWELAPALVAYGWTAESVDAAAAPFASERRGKALSWLGAGLMAQELLAEIQVSARAISAIVGAVKSYTHLDQAPVQDVDVKTGLEDTLMILNHKLKHGIEVVRDYSPNLPRIEAYGSELNQVWTNIIDNAIQAMDGQGRLEISTQALGDEVEVRIADSGPGIPSDVAPRIFDPFFSTKPQGVGTGLGLHIAHNIIVNRHSGRIEFTTRPGRTEFRVVLPVTLGGKTAETA